MSTKAADRGRNKATKRRGRGHPPFIPTDDQRRFVTALAGIRMTWEEIRQLVVNPQTGEPITKTTLARAFKRELADGKAKLKSLVATRFYEALRRGDPWAVQMGLKTQFDWKPDGAGGFIMPPDPEGERRAMRIEFVLPTSNLRDEDRDEEGPRPGQRLLPPPRERPMPGIED
jgi:hypothetical protein